MVFERKWSTTNNLLFHSKMRALMWVRCGGVLRDLDGVARALFSGPVAAKDSITAETKRLRSWMLKSIFKDIENRMIRVGNVSFLKAEKHGNEMAYALALARIKRPGMFKAWW
ncbi:hypothetical protein Goari_001622 [Gossypium aridum]|uniref:RNase H type-1 domain-containing protein n=1 Tax=Gossypium aridum TaxID=34290 RepID=A0A7J8YKB1_GOSAI|nr:hypothetical protein [Gossypium aridum]